MRVDLKTDFERLFELVSPREKQKYHSRLERQASRIKCSITSLNETETDCGLSSPAKPDHQATLGDFSLTN